MQTFRKSDFSYGGFGLTVSPLRRRKRVTIIGVMSPVDPGMVRVKEGKQEYDCPTMVLDDCPIIDFGKMLSKQQKNIRRRLGGLLGTGVKKERKLIPLSECPLTTLEAINRKIERGRQRYLKSKRESK